MELQTIPLTAIDGSITDLRAWDGDAILVVNVASKCGFTPQYEQLEALQRKYEDRGFTVLGFPCNQFLSQEPGTSEEIQQFCSLTYGVTFPMFEKVKVNGRDRHPLFAELTKALDASGKAGRVRWNFEKFLISPDGSVQRFRSRTAPDDPEVVSAIEAVLPR